MSGELQVRHLGDDRFAIDVRGHEIVVDQPVDAGGQDTDPAGLPDHFRRGRFTMTSSSACAAGHR